MNNTGNRKLRCHRSQSCARSNTGQCRFWFSFWIALALVFPCGAFAQLNNALDPERDNLFRVISAHYTLNGAEIPIDPSYEADLAKATASPNPFVQSTIHNLLEVINMRKACDAETTEVMENNQTVLSAKSAKTLVKIAGDQADNDLMGFAHDLLNSEPFLRITWMNAIQREFGTAEMKRLSAVRQDITRDAEKYSRGGILDSNEFFYDIGYNPTKALVLLRLRNNTDHVLHHALILVDVKCDTSKVEAEEQQNSSSAALAGAFIDAAGSSDTETRARAALSRANKNVNRTDHGTTVYVPELPPRQWIEIEVAPYTAVRFADSCVFHLFSDEGYLHGISLPASAIQMGVNFVPPPVLPTSEEGLATMHKQWESVTESPGTNCIIYKFLSYPLVWSQAIVFPPNTKNFNLVWTDGMKIAVLANDQALVDPANIKYNRGTRLRFMSRSTRPVETAIQFDFGSAPTGQLSFTPWPTQPPPMTKIQLAQRDKIISMLRSNSGFVGIFDRPRVINTEVEANLKWNESEQFVTGWLFFNRTKAKKLVEGRIVNDGTGPLYLQLVETGYAPDNQNRVALMGICYILYADELNGGLKADWMFQGARGSLTLKNK